MQQQQHPSTPKSNPPRTLHASPPSFKVHLTLPLACAICLGRVRSPVICQNRHIMCEPCIDEWLKRKAECPTCRVPITVEKPCLSLIGGRVSDEGAGEMGSPTLASADKGDDANRLALLRTRMDILLNQYEKEILDLRGRKGSDPKRQSIPLVEDDSNPFMDSTTPSSLFKQERDPNSNFVPSPKRKHSDLATLSTDLYNTLETHREAEKAKRIKLATESEAFRKENAALKENLCRLQEENRLLRHATPPSQFSPTKAGFAALKMRIRQLEQENEALNAALRKSDEFIEELQRRVRVE
ncbi:hypothetical protein HDU67_003969 [Dinochytrium kinnereticum]|nr:hypothetical protein HDU67_003969 [Dinochytrium kinnereticum]